MLTELLEDLRAEHDVLRAIVSDVDLALLVPAEPWDVRDTVSHLLVGDAKGLLAATDPDAFSAELPQVIADPVAYLESWLEPGRGLSKATLLETWHTGFEQMVTAFAAVPPGTKVPWYGPPMSPVSFATARTWSTGRTARTSSTRPVSTGHPPHGSSTSLTSACGPAVSPTQ